MDVVEEIVARFHNADDHAVYVERVLALAVVFLYGKPVLLLYYVMTDEATPRSVKLSVGAALAYLVLPIDLISGKKHPLLGKLDEATAIVAAYQKVKKHVTPEMERKADETLDRWFPENTPFEVVNE